MWNKLVKKLAGYAFTWGLRILTEKYGEGKPVPPPPARKPRHRKTYVN